MLAWKRSRTGGSRPSWLRSHYDIEEGGNKPAGGRESCRG